jgi:hypothetical protein
VGDVPAIAFTPADGPDALPKNIHPGVPAFLDFLSANTTNDISHVIKSHMSQKVVGRKCSFILTILFENRCFLQ